MSLRLQRFTTPSAPFPLSLLYLVTLEFACAPRCLRDYERIDDHCYPIVDVDAQVEDPTTTGASTIAGRSGTAGLGDGGSAGRRRPSPNTSGGVGGSAEDDDAPAGGSSSAGNGGHGGAT